MRQTQNASKKDNRKSILVIGLLLLLVAVIGFGGYTMSKYVTKKSVQGNTAQVANGASPLKPKTLISYLAINTKPAALLLVPVMP